MPRVELLVGTNDTAAAAAEISITSFDHTTFAWRAWWALGFALALAWIVGGAYFLQRAKQDRNLHHQNKKNKKKPSTKCAERRSTSIKKTPEEKIYVPGRNRISRKTSSKSSQTRSRRRSGSLNSMKGSGRLHSSSAPGIFYGVLLASMSRRHREAHELRVKEDAAAIEAVSTNAHEGELRVRVCGRNPERIAGWIALYYELPCFVSLCFLSEDAWSFENSEKLRSVWVATGSIFEWHNEAWVVGTFGLYSTLLLGTVVLGRAGRTQRPLLRVFVLDILLIRVVNRAVSMLACSYSSNSPTINLEAIPSVLCWQGRHWAYAAGAVALLVGEYFAALRHALVTRNQRRPAFRYSVRFNLIFVMGKVLATTVSMAFRGAPHFSLTVLLVTMVGLLVANTIMAPCRGDGRLANNLRTTTFAVTAWTAACSLLSLQSASVAGIAVLVGVLPIAGIAWSLNDRVAASKVSIPALPVSELLLGDCGPYVQEVACASLALAKRRPVLDTALLDRLWSVVKDPGTSSSLRLWAAQTLLRHHAPRDALSETTSSLSSSGRIGGSKRSIRATMVKSMKKMKVVVPVLDVDVVGECTEERHQLQASSAIEQPRASATEQPIASDARDVAITMMTDKCGDAILRARAAHALRRFCTLDQVGPAIWLMSHALCLIATPCVGAGVLRSAIGMRNALAAFDGAAARTAALGADQVHDYIVLLAACYERTVSDATKESFVYVYARATISARMDDSTLQCMRSVAALLETCVELFSVRELTSSSRYTLLEFVEILVRDEAVYALDSAVQLQAETLLRRMKGFGADGSFEEALRTFARIDKLRAKADHHCEVAFDSPDTESMERIERHRGKLLKMVNRAAGRADDGESLHVAVVLAHHIGRRCADDEDFGRKLLDEAVNGNARNLIASSGF